MTAPARRWWITVIALQFALVVLVYDPWMGGAVTVNHVACAANGSALAVGTPFPPMPLYAESGRRVDVLAAGRRPATLIVADTCGCQVARVRDWAESAGKRGERVVIAFTTAPRDLPMLAKEVAAPGRICAMRQTDLHFSLGLDKAPAAIHLTPAGTILAVER